MARFRRLEVWTIPAPDAVLAAVMCLVAVASVLTGNPAEGPVAVTLPVAVAASAALLMRRRSPMVAAAVLLVATMVQTVLAQTPGSLWSLVILVIVMYSMAAHLEEGSAAIAGAVFVVVLLVEERLADGVDYLFTLLLFGGVWVLGRASRRWRGQVSLAERRQREAAHLAAAEERLRIARDLHDVVAHSLSVIAVQADAAEAALAVDPERAAEPVRTIRTTAREALTEIRGVLDLLRNDDARTPGALDAAALTGLVEAARCSGAVVELRQDIAGVPLTPDLTLALYRVAQESLTNALRHAPGADIIVDVAREGDTLTVRVANTAPAVAPDQSGSGYGIEGMRERAEALGGSLRAGRTPLGGFEVEALLPLRERPATGEPR